MKVTANFVFGAEIYSRARGKSLLISPVPSKCLSDLFCSSTHSCLQPRLTHGSEGCCPPECLPCARLGPGTPLSEGGQESSALVEGISTFFTNLVK